jgi:hypothetical protein
MIQLANNSEDLTKYLPLNKGFDHVLLEPDIDDALRDYVLPYLSRAQFDASLISTDAKHTELMSIVKKSAFNLALASWLPMGKVMISEAGIQSGVDKDRQATSEDKADAISSAKNKGLRAIDQMLEFLEDNAATFTVWAGSEAFTVLNSSFLRSAKEFAIIEGSRSVFLRLKPYIEDVERQYLSELIPETVYNVLLSRKYTDISEENQVIYQRFLTNYIMPFVRDMSMAKAARAMAIIKNQFGTLTVFDNTGASHAKGFKTVQKELLEGWIEDLTHSAHGNLTKLASFLELNKVAFGIETEEKPARVIYRNDILHGTAFF